MARDIWIRWKAKPPSRVAVRKVLEDYVRDLATKIEWLNGRYYVFLPGLPSHAFQRVGPASKAQRAMWPEDRVEHDGSPRRRFFEVYWSDQYMDIMTRFGDDITNVIAGGFAELAARAWKGTIEPP